MTTSKIRQQKRGSSLVVIIVVVATILVLVGIAVQYSQHVSRQAQRSRKAALAVEIADGHLENLFTWWRNLSRIQVNLAIKKKAQTTINSYALPTQYFFTDSYNPGPPPSPSVNSVGLSSPPPIIALPDTSLFPTESRYNVTQYRIQAVTPMVELQKDRPDLYPTPTDPEGSIVPVTDSGDGSANATSSFKPAFGPNTSTTNGQYSFYYLAAVDVTVPAIGTQSGAVTAKVRRVFEKKYDEPFTYAIFYNDDLELQPASVLNITGPVHTNGSLYIGTSNFTAQPPSMSFPTSGRVTFSTQFVNGASPNDPLHTSFSAPNFPPTEPPAMQAAYLPYGWNLNLTNTNANNNDNYHELIEYVAPDDPSDDPIAAFRWSKQATYRVVMTNQAPQPAGSTAFTSLGAATPVYIQITDTTGAAVATNNGDGKVIMDALTVNNGATLDQAVIQDVREGGPVLVTSVDIGAVSSKSSLQMLYLTDRTAGSSTTVTFNGASYTTSKRAIRIRNGASLLPAVGITVVSENPVYIQGDFNTGSSPPSDSGTYTSPLGSGYTWKPAAIIGDSINVLSNAWSDTTPTASRVASNTTINAALMGGIVASNGTNYSGGGENFVRLLENWNGKSFTYYGSMVQLWQSMQGTGLWTGSSTVYTAPSNNNWYYDIHFMGNPSNPANNNNPVPPGNFQLAAYLQQQRWYQVY